MLSLAPRVGGTGFLLQRCLPGIYSSKRLYSCAPRHNGMQMEMPHVYNSLTKSKTSIEPGNQPLKWYSCGPTVYDASHVGHARNYVSQDIIRRILMNYFGYDVHLVMNITDIDDKIIAKTRENFFIERFSSEHNGLSHALITAINALWQEFVTSHLASHLPGNAVHEGSWPKLCELMDTAEWKDRHLQKDGKLKLHISSAKRCFDSLKAAQVQLNSGATGNQFAEELIYKSKDILGPMLNMKASAGRASRYSVTKLNQFQSELIDPALYKRTAALWESRFFEDMSRLNVLPPDTVTRASEYVPRIIEFIEGIIEKKHAYVSNGSVYFDTQAFNQTERQSHKLLSVSKMRHGVSQAFSSDKKSFSDFSLWKKAKPGEPSWASPWGPGRPGWHIECSAMASSIFGDNIHIHSGGIDLLFPHHANELAQSEAYHGCKEWVDCFIHIGHLHVDGLKMSKSLKNFTTIEELLDTYTPRQVRLAFLLRPWDARLDFSDEMMSQEVVPLEALLNNFFSHVSSLALDDATYMVGRPFGVQERDLRTNFDHAKILFRKALTDSMNTVSAINTMRTLISQTFVYINANTGSVDCLLIQSIARWMSAMLQLFGLGEDSGSHLGWQVAQPPQNGATGPSSLPYLQVLSCFRDDVRRIAKGKSASIARELLILSDKLREDVLPPLGVRLADRADGPALIKFVTPGGSTTAKTQASTPRERIKERSKMNPFEMFKPPHMVGLYSSWDGSGIPLTDGRGVDLSQNRRKKLQKAWLRQKTLYDQNHDSNQGV